jgi:hypothetical protein
MGWRYSSFAGKAGLFEHLSDSILSAAAKLSHFVASRTALLMLSKQCGTRFSNGFIASFLWNCCRNDNTMSRMYQIYVALLRTRITKFFKETGDDSVF